MSVRYVTKLMNLGGYLHEARKCILGLSVGDTTTTTAEYYYVKHSV